MTIRASLLAVLLICGWQPAAASDLVSLAWLEGHWEAEALGGVDEELRFVRR